MSNRAHITQSSAIGGAGRAGTVAAVILLMALVCFTIALCVNPGPASDLYWQLRTGRVIAEQHHAPHFDTYSWTRSGTPWVAHEWLAFLLFWWCYAGMGFSGVWLLTAALSIAIGAVLYCLVLGETRSGFNDSQGGAPMTAFILSTVALIASDAFLQPRPQLFTYLFSLVTLAVIRRARQAGDGSAERALWLLVPLFALWANLHAGVLIGVGLVVFYAVGSFVASRLRGGKHKFNKTLGLVAVVGFLATLLTPYSYHEYANIAATVTNSVAMNVVTEWSTPNFHDPFGRQVEILIGCMLGAVLLTRLRRSYIEIGLLAVLIHEALSADRNVPLCALLGTVLVARHVQSCLVRFLYADRTPVVGALFGAEPSLTMVALVFVAIGFSSFGRTAEAVQTSGPTRGAFLTRVALASISYGSNPNRACDFIEHEHFPATMRMYNTYDDGGFLIWRLPEFPVFVDSRADVYFGPTLEQVNDLNSLVYSWREILKSRGVDFIVVSASNSESRLFLAASDWALVYADRADLGNEHVDYARQSNSLIFVRRDPKFQEIIARCRRDCPVLAQNQLAPFKSYRSLR